MDAKKETTKAAAAVINITEEGSLTAIKDSENKGIINVNGKLNASNLKQTEADARIVIGEKAAKGSVTLSSSSNQITGGRIMVANKDQVKNAGSAPLAIEITDEKGLANIPGILNVVMNGDFELSANFEGGHNVYIQDGSTLTLTTDVTMGSTVYVEGDVTVTTTAKDGADWTLMGASKINGTLTLGKGVTLKTGTSASVTVSKGGDIAGEGEVDSTADVKKEF